MEVLTILAKWWAQMPSATQEDQNYSTCTYQRIWREPKELTTSYFAWRKCNLQAWWRTGLTKSSSPEEAKKEQLWIIGWPLCLINMHKSKQRLPVILIYYRQTKFSTIREVKKGEGRPWTDVQDYSKSDNGEQFKLGSYSQDRKWVIFWLSAILLRHQNCSGRLLEGDFLKAWQFKVRQKPLEHGCTPGELPKMEFLVMMYKIEMMINSKLQRMELLCDLHPNW